MVHLLIKRQQNLCAVMVIFPGDDKEQILAIDTGQGMSPLIFEESSEDHLEVIRLAQQAKEQMPDVKLEVVRFANREHMSWIEKEDDNDSSK